MKAWRVLAVVFLLLSRLLHADIISFKDGNVLECKILEQTVKGGAPVYVVQLEDGKTQHVKINDIAWIAKARPSWEARKEEKAWYAAEVEKKAEKLKKGWKQQEALGRVCKRKRFLSDEAEKHFTAAYELRKRELKDKVKDHEKIARWLERTCGLFKLARVEWAWVFGRKLEETKAKKKVKDTDYYKLGQWAEKKSLYEEAEQCYKRTLELNPGYANAIKALKRVDMLRNNVVNPSLFRSIKDAHTKAVASLRDKGNRDGSYGKDVEISAIQAHRAITALCLWALLGEWEFSALADPSLAEKPPKEITRALDWYLKQGTSPTKLWGPDIHGNMFGVYALSRVLANPGLGKYHDRVKAKIAECCKALAGMQGRNGGWVYYSKNKNAENSFIGAGVLIALLGAKRVGAKIDQGSFNKGLQHLKTTKQQDGVWMYKSGKRQTVEGSQGRAGGCELALFLCGEGSAQAIDIAVENFFKYRHILEAVKGKRGTHMGTGGTAPYYYLWGHLFLSMAMQRMEPDRRDKYAARLRDLFLKDQETDGSFTDWPLSPQHKLFGTALGALTLYHLGTVVRVAVTGHPR